MDSGAGLVLSTVHFSPSIVQQKQIYIIAKLMMWVWCIMNGRIVYAFTGAC